MTFCIVFCGKLLNNLGVHRDGVVKVCDIQPPNCEKLATGLHSCHIFTWIWHEVCLSHQWKVECTANNMLLSISTKTNGKCASADCIAIR